MANLYPRPQTIFIFVACAITVGGFLYYTESGSSPNSQAIKVNDSVIASNSATTPITGSLANDWQKQFLTKGNSTVNLNGKPASPKPTYVAKTLTDKMGQAFLTQYMDLAQKNLTDNDQFVANAAQQTIDEAVSQAQFAKTYTTKDIVIARGSDSAAIIHAYGNAIAKILINDSPHVNSLEIASQAFEKQDMTLLAQIDPAVKAYKKMMADLLTTPVPQSLINEHIDLLNGFSSIEHMAETLRNIQKDPMTAIVAMDASQKGQDLATAALNSIKTFLASSGATYRVNEPGSLFASVDLTLQ